MTARYVRPTSVEDQREFVEHLQIGKQIGKLLDMPKRPRAQKHMFLWGIKYDSSERSQTDVLIAIKDLN